MQRYPFPMSGKGLSHDTAGHGRMSFPEPGTNLSFREFPQKAYHAHTERPGHNHILSCSSRLVARTRLSARRILITVRNGGDTSEISASVAKAHPCRITGAENLERQSFLPPGPRGSISRKTGKKQSRLNRKGWRITSSFLLGTGFPKESGASLRIFAPWGVRRYEYASPGNGTPSFMKTPSSGKPPGTS